MNNWPPGGRKTGGEEGALGGRKSREEEGEKERGERACEEDEIWQQVPYPVDVECRKRCEPWR